MKFGEWIEAVANGTVTFAEFVKATQPRWHRLAIYLAGKWKQPAWHGLEDIEQELILGAWRFIWKYQPDYAARSGTTHERYVIFNSIDCAKKALHRARGAKLCGSADRNPSHIHRPLAAWDEEGQKQILALLVSECEQEAVIDYGNRVDQAKKHCETVRELLSVEAVAKTGSIDEGAATLYQDPDLRGACRFNSEDHALMVVTRAIVSVAQRMQQVQV